MFEEWKRVWRETVDNFNREAGSGPASLAADRRQAAMRRELADARAELRRLSSDLVRTQGELQEQREGEAACRRRRAQADRIGDAETARLAAAFADRHADRARILERKAEVLQSEYGARMQDLQDMESALEQMAGADAAPDEAGPELEGAEPAAASAAGRARGTESRVVEDDEFVSRKMQREARERAAEARLEELKKRMK